MRARDLKFLKDRGFKLSRAYWTPKGFRYHVMFPRKLRCPKSSKR
jgi:hypothetical protein